MAQLSAKGGTWSPTGTMLYRLEKFIYYKPIRPGDWIHWKLGAIKLRNDGRWNWWRWESEFFPEWQEDQGVALTKMGATYMVHLGWYDMAVEPARMADVYEYSQEIRPHAWGKRKVVLGRVIDTHTGVWTWIRHKSKIHPEWKPGRGTSASRRLAHQNLMDGWK